MTSAETQLVAALLRFAAEPDQDLHTAVNLVRPTGRLATAAWSLFYASGHDAAQAARRLDPPSSPSDLRSAVIEAVRIARRIATATNHILDDDFERLAELERLTHP